MAKLRDYEILDFSGGLVRDTSDYQMQRNQFPVFSNLEIDDKGRAKRRRGMQYHMPRFYGASDYMMITDSILYNRVALGTSYTQYHLIVDNEGKATSQLGRIVSDYSPTAIAALAGTIVLNDSSLFSAPSGIICINGNRITYTGNDGATTLTGCGSVNAHPAFSLVTQYRLVDLVDIDTRYGAYFAVLNNICLIFGAGPDGGIATFDGTNIGAVTDPDDAPGGVYPVRYRRRIYVAGSGAADAAGVRNGAPNKLIWSDVDDATSWDIDNHLVVEDDLTEMITGLKVSGDVLCIFKKNSIFTYDEIQLKQRIYGVGAYSHECVQKIGNLMYTFCPAGVYATNGYSAKHISAPIDQYLRSFKPNFRYGGYRSIRNCFSGQLNEVYYLYLLNTSDPESKSNIMFAYDTKKGSWTIYEDMYEISALFSLPGFSQGTAGNTSSAQRIPSMFGAGYDGEYWKFFDKRYLDNSSPLAHRGGDIIADNISSEDSRPLGEAINTTLETPWISGGSADFKRFGSILALIEQGDFTISYKLDQGKNRLTDWIPLGEFRSTRDEKPLRTGQNEGFRIKLRVASNSREMITILNGLIIRGMETLEGRAYA